MFACVAVFVDGLAVVIVVLTVVVVSSRLCRPFDLAWVILGDVMSCREIHEATSVEVIGTFACVVFVDVLFIASIQTLFTHGDSDRHDSTIIVLGVALVA